MTSILWCNIHAGIFRFLELNCAYIWSTKHSTLFSLLQTGTMLLWNIYFQPMTNHLFPYHHFWLHMSYQPTQPTGLQVDRSTLFATFVIKTIMKSDSRISTAESIKCSCLDSLESEFPITISGWMHCIEDCSVVYSSRYRHMRCQLIVVTTIII